MKLIDKYFRNPILYDYVISVIIVIGLISLTKQNYLSLPAADKTSLFSSDLGAIGFTVSGFILTLITILLTLRSGQIISQEKLTNSSSPFKVFLGSPLYAKSIDILKYGVLSLVIISLLLYLLKLLVPDSLMQFLFYFNIVGLIIIFTTFLRCFYVLGLIMKMQNSRQEDLKF